MEHNLYDLDTLRKKVYTIPGRFIMSIGLLVLMLNTKWEHIADSFLMTVALFFMLYGFVSYFVLWLLSSHNLGLVTIVAAITGVTLLIICKNTLPFVIVLIIMIGAVVRDVFNTIKYFKLRDDINKSGVPVKKLTRNERMRYELEKHLEGSSFSRDNVMFENCDTKEEYDERLKMLREMYKDNPAMLERANKEYLKNI